MTAELLDKLADFSLKNFPYKDRELIKEYLLIHEANKTLIYALDDKEEVIGMIRFNARPDTGTGEILDFAIREDWRNKGLFKDFIKRALETWPMGKYLKFYRDLKQLGAKPRIIPIAFILSHNF
jgi:GNAT superfamily N-acetyltransferase